MQSCLQLVDRTRPTVGRPSVVTMILQSRRSHGRIPMNTNETMSPINGLWFWAWIGEPYASIVPTNFGQANQLRTLPQRLLQAPLPLVDLLQVVCTSPVEPLESLPP